MGSLLVHSFRTLPSSLLPLTGSSSSGTCSMVVGKGPSMSWSEGLSCLWEAQGEGNEGEPVVRGPGA